jgi:four helix bundle protein
MAKHKPTSYADWEANVPTSIRNGPVWKSLGYRKALFLYDLVWEDCDSLLKDVRGQTIARQIIRGAGSISANMEEGFGHGLGKDYARILGIAVGEARETQGWYFRARRLLPDVVIQHRLALLDEIIALLLTMIGRQRRKAT